jgi:hypothetical protein
VARASAASSPRSSRATKTDAGATTKDLDVVGNKPIAFTDDDANISGCSSGVS